MVSKTFEHTVAFYEAQDGSGRPLYVPLVQVNLLTPRGSRIQLSLLFDTGADVTSLRADLYPLLGLTSWDEGQAINICTAGGNCVAYQYTGVIELFGKSISCPIHLIPMPLNPLVHGLLGRDTIFREFGFGFWECNNELYITPEPQVSRS